MKVVSDTSVLIAIALGEPERQEILRLSANYELYAPSVLPYEVGNALSALMKRKLLGTDEAREAWDHIQRIPVELRRTNIRASLQLAGEHKLYAYDAYFLECAVSLQCSLMTLDQKLQSIATKIGLDVIEVAEK